MAGNKADCCAGAAFEFELTSLCSCSLKCCVLRLQAAWVAGAKLPGARGARKARGGAD